MKLALLSTIAILASCGHRATVTPAYLTIHATAAQCETVAINSHNRTLGECRYTVEDSTGVHFRRIEFRRTR